MTVTAMVNSDADRGGDADLEALDSRSLELCDRRPLYPGFRGWTTYEA